MAQLLYQPRADARWGHRTVPATSTIQLPRLGPATPEPNISCNVGPGEPTAPSALGLVGPVLAAPTRRGKGAHMRGAPMRAPPHTCSSLSLEFCTVVQVEKQSSR